MPTLLLCRNAREGRTFSIGRGTRERVSLHDAPADLARRPTAVPPATYDDVPHEGTFRGVSSHHRCTWRYSMKTEFWLRAPAVLLLVLAPGCQREPTLLEPAFGKSDGVAFAASNFSEWSAPVNLGSSVNSAFEDQTPALSRDGLTLYFGSPRPGGFGLGDLWVSRRASRDDPWGSAENVGPTINTAASEVAPFVSRDGHTLFFVSNRAGGFGDFDVMTAWRAHTHDAFGWEAPVNVGAPLNTNAFEGGMTVHGSEFYFSSGANTNVPHDIYVSEMHGNGFSARVLSAELSSTSDERRPTIRYDGREIFFGSNRPGGSGFADLWSSERSGNGRPWLPPTNLGSGINSAFADQNPYLSQDGTMLVFASNRPGGSGGLDLYYMTRSIGEPNSRR